MLARLQERRQEARRSDYARFRGDPCGFIEGVLGCLLTGQQRTVAESVRDFPVTVVQSANAVGKTFVAAGIATWWLRCFMPSKCVTTAAPPLENLKLLLWGEIGTRLAGAGEVFAGAEVGVLHARFDEEWWLTGRAIPMSGTPSEREAKFSGVHSPHLLFIIDEGDAVPDEVYRGIESCMSGGLARLLVLFNPRAAMGPVFQLVRNRRANVVTLDAFHHPNVVEGREVVPGAVTREKTVLRVAEWSAVDGRRETGDRAREDAQAREDARAREDAHRGAGWFRVPGFLDGAVARRADGSLTSPLVGDEWRHVENPALAYMVLAEFPGQAENQLISRAWVEAAQARWQAWRAMHGNRPPEGVAPVLGQDVAEFGSDRNVCCARYGGWVVFEPPWNGVDVLVTGDRCARVAKEREARAVLVDATGVGAGVAPQVRRWLAQFGGGFRCEVVDVKVASAPTVEVEEGAFGMLRDQVAWLCREWLRSDPGAMLPPGEDVADELCAFTYRVQRGVIRVCGKDELRVRLRRSPDMADGLFLTFAPVHSWGVA